MIQTKRRSLGSKRGKGPNHQTIPKILRSAYGFLFEHPRRYYQITELGIFERSYVL